MNDLILYIAKTLVIGAILWYFYSLVLRNETFHKFNRVYLIISSWLISILPWFGTYFNILEPISEPQSVKTSITLPEIIITAKGIISPEKETLWLNGSLYLYGIIVTVFLTGTIISMIHLLKTIRNIRKSKPHHDNVYIIKEGTPFSFLGNIFIPEKYIKSPAYHTILIHEQAHINQHHSIDNIMIDVLICFNWYNPFIYLIKKSLKATHEFLADQEVIRQGTDSVIYQQIC